MDGIQMRPNNAQTGGFEKRMRGESRSVMVMVMAGPDRWGVGTLSRDAPGGRDDP